MNTKRLITASIFSLISASTALAADVLIPHQTTPSAPSSTIVAPTFSWTGFYLGVQAGGFSSKADMALVGQEKSFPLDKEFSPKLSGFAGGFYAGSNIDLGDSFIFGVDTDLMLSGKKHTKTITIGAADNVIVKNAAGRSRRSAEVVQPTSTQSAASQPTQAQTGQSNQLATSDSSNNVNSTKTEKKVMVEGASGVSTPPSKTPSAPKSTPSTTEVSSPERSTLSSARSDTGKQSSGQLSLSSSGKSAQGQSAALAVSTGQRAAAASSKSVASPVTSKPISSVSSEQSMATKSTSGQSSLAARTVPSGTLVLSRSGSSNGSETRASNGTTGTQHGGHHSAYGSGHSNPHGASHPGGHGSSANPHGSHGANPHTFRPHGVQSQQAADKSDSSVYGIEQIKKMASELGFEQGDEVETLNHTFKQNWGGATRVRIGFAADRFMPYLAGGIAYGQFQDTVSVSVKGEDGSVVSSRNLTDETKTMIGYTLGGGVDFSVLDNVIVRAEYRYSDFGKKKFAKEKFEINYKTNDFRVGVAYKF
ncbi:outer membrane protein [Bartonella sp. ML70XJBT]|uniref:outer membrane protein n=1 Tax=Bartonella sp. ML70XJBT TaxID=3019096 RepID=UPI002362B954|nr:outer membrane beta-barrel protein [Bartonella sp. ML70XJBT]